jgi:positive regulator of sigma E activity
MEGKGVVKYIDNQKIIIASYKKSSCDKCKTCTEGGKFQSECEFRIKKNPGIEIGDIVSFSVKDKKILQYSFVVYIFPIFGFFLGNYLVKRFFSSSSELIEVLGSFLGMVVFFLFVNIFDRRQGETILDTLELVKKNTIQGE